jgi:excisionase family DNA binding protein
MSANASKGKVAGKVTGRAAGKGSAKPASQGGVAKGAGGDAGLGELIGMDEAVEMLKTTRPTFYRWVRSGKLKGMKLGRQWRFYRADVERFLKGEEPRIDLPADITPLIDALRGRIAELGVKVPSLEGISDVRRATYYMILLAMNSKASDIHITSHIEGAQTVVAVRLRIDGVLHEVARIDVRLLPAVVEELKRMAACDVHEKEKPQDGRIVIEANELGGAGGAKEGEVLDLRVCFLPAALGEAVTVRLLDRAAVNLRLDRIDYAPKDRERILRAVHSPWGLIVVTGPVGSGKTTTLYSCLNELAKPGVKIMSVEDPVEYYLPWTTQVAVREAAGKNFAYYVRAMLRSDPDVILIGEMRDYDTLCAAMQSSLTGHLVMTTLHANDAVGALKRMVDMGMDPFVVADSTKLVMSQRLVRKLCPACSVEDTPEPKRLDVAAEAARKGGLDWHALEPKFRRAVGCDKCAKTGYRGRTVIAETLEVTREIGRALRDGAPAERLGEIAVSQGMTTLAADGVRRAAAGETTLDEVLRVVG